LTPLKSVARLGAGVRTRRRRPTARLDRALGFGRDSEPLREAIALACAKGWIARVEGRVFIPGTTVPTPDQGPAAKPPAKPELPHRERSQEPAAERYEVMASAIKAHVEANGRLSHADLAAALGVSPGASAFRRALAPLRADGFDAFGEEHDRDVARAREAIPACCATAG
jgi:hypothetical protein